jgi:membrane protease YdiL (CAAX protease family)
MKANVVTPYVEADTETQMHIHRARQGLLVFARLLIPLSLFGYWFYVTFPNAPLILPSLPLMFSPGLASIITRLMRREGFAYLLGLAKFDPPPFPVAASSPLAQFGVNVIFSAILMILLLPSTGGEEIGWRGYLLPRMIQARIPQPVLLTSLIWGAWHLPVLFAGVYAVGSSPLPSAAGLMVATLALGSILARIRLRAGSVWPCITAHAAWNAIINGAFTPATQNAPKTYGSEKLVFWLS